MPGKGRQTTSAHGVRMMTAALSAIPGIGVSTAAMPRLPSTAGQRVGQSRYGGSMAQGYHSPELQSFHPVAVSGASLERLNQRQKNMKKKSSGTIRGGGRTIRATRKRKVGTVESRLQIPSLQDYMKLYQPLDSSVCPQALLNQVERGVGQG